MGERRYIKTGRLVDGSGEDVQKNRVLVVDNGIIERIISIAEIPKQTAAEIVDLTHCSVMPPLMDCSVDLSRSSSIGVNSGNNSDTAARKRTPSDIARHVHFCHSHGVLGVADCTGVDQVKKSAHQLHAFADTVAIKTAGQLLTSEVEAVSEVVDDGVDYLKIAHAPTITSQGSNGEYQSRYKLEKLEWAISIAKRAGLQTVVVANGERSVAEAIASGCDAVEQGCLMGKKNLEEMARRQLLYIPSLIMVKTAHELTSGERAKQFQKLLEKQLFQLEQARNLGVPVAIGTGAGNDGIIHGEAVVEEIKLFIKAGYSFVEALRASTIVGAEFFGVAEINTLQPGNVANFIVSRGMVQQLPRKLSYLENIFCGGSPSGNYRKNPVKTVHPVNLR